MQPSASACARSQIGSMGRVGACGDNAAMESFFSPLQKNVLNPRTWATRDQLRISMVTWIECTYHRRRRQDGMGRLTPIGYEAIMTTTANQAA
jgi:putative transposase